VTRRTQRKGEKAGTRRYPPDTGEYPASDEPPRTSDSGSSGREQAADAGTNREREWWERAGFASFEDALAHNEQQWDRIMGRPVRDLNGLSVEEILFSEPIRRPKVARRRVRERQVGVKLTAEDYSALVKAARRYGVPPSTLARIFIVRGTQAALERDQDRD
jgi:hypothetical protein